MKVITEYILLVTVCVIALFVVFCATGILIQQFIAYKNNKNKK